MKNKLVIAIIALLLTTVLCRAEDADNDYPHRLNDVANYFIIYPIVRSIFIFGVLGSWMHNYGSSFSNNFDKVILMNPSVLDQNAPLYNSSMANLMGFPIRLFTPAYVLAIIAIAFYMLFLPASSKGRAGAKNLLVKLMVSMIFFSASPVIFETMLQISYNLTRAILTEQVVENARLVFEGGIWAGYWIMAHVAMSDTELGIPFWGSLYAMAWLPYMVIFVRYIMVTMLGLVFPLGILLYSAPFFKSIGKKILEMLIVWIFMQVFLASAVAAVSLGAGYYSVIPQENNAILSGLNVVPAPDISQTLNVIMSLTTGSSLEQRTAGTPLTASTYMHTTILAFTLGSAAYGLMFAVPLMMMRLLGDFLP